MKKILSFRKSTALMMSTVIIFTLFSGSLRNTTGAETLETIDYSNCIYRIEPENYYTNSLEDSTLRRDYTYLYDDGMNDGDNSELIEMGPYVYTSGNDNGGGKLTYKFPYATNELLLTGIEVINDENNRFQNFEVSTDGENWQKLDMTANYEDSVVSSISTSNVGNRRGVKYYGSTTEKFVYFRVEFGRCWMPGINYLYIPESDAMANCKNKVDPKSLPHFVDNDATFVRYSNFTYDDVGGAAFNKASSTVTFTLPYAVDSLSFTAMEIYWPNTTREKFHFRNIEVSMDGVNWSQFTMAVGNFEFVKENAGYDTLNGVTYPVHRLGVTYFGTSNTTFRYIRMKSDSNWDPGLCNFYLPDMSCTNRIEPDTYYYAPDGYTVARYYSSTVMYDDGMNDTDNAEFVSMFPLIFRGEGTEKRKLQYKLPYDVNELLLTGIQSAKPATETGSLFKTFEVSQDGINWVTLNMTATTENTVIGTDGVVNTNYVGVKYYGSSAFNFRYFRVEFGQNWCPGINYLYIPESSAKTYCTDKVDPMSLEMTNSSTVKFARFTTEGNSNYAYYDGVDGAGFTEGVSGGASLTFNLNKPVTSFGFTAVEIYWPNAKRENFRFKSVEVSPDGTSWSPLTMSASDFEFMKQKASTDTVNATLLPIHWIGVKYFGTSDTPFSYVRLTTKSQNAYQPKLCNFYLPDNYTDVKGDANGDFRFNVIDLVRIKKYIAGITGTIYHDADLNSDSEYNAIDIAIIINMILTGDSMDKLQGNIVPATNQNAKHVYYYDTDGNECDDGNTDDFKIMFVGNSITKHSRKPEIGWYNDCGMSASSPDKDYVHLVVNKCKTEYREDTSFSICQIADYEVTRNPEILEERYSEIKDYNPDIVIMFFGANVPSAYDTETEHEYPFGDAYEYLRNYIKGENDSILFFHSDGFYIRPVLDEEKKIVAKKYGDTYINIEDIRERTDAHGQFNHPGDLGMSLIAERFWDAIKPVLPEV